MSEASVEPLFKSGDLPERLSPMTVKELRQGLRRGIFIYPFIGIHVLAIVAMAVEFQMDEATLERGTDWTGILNMFLFLPGGMYSGPFWAVVGVVCLILMPLGGLALMGQELEEGNHELLLLTPLSRWKVIRGKFFALWGLCLLTFSSLLPYVIVRYFIGGIDVSRNIGLAMTVVLFSGMMAAGAIGASSFTGIASRIAILILFVATMLSCLGIVLGVAGHNLARLGPGYSDGLKSAIWSFNAASAAFCYIIFGLALARSRIRLVVHHYEVKPSWMIIGLLFFTPFVVVMATLMTIGFAGGLGLVGMGLVAWFADVSPKAPKWAAAPIDNTPSPPGTVVSPPALPPVASAPPAAPPPIPESGTAEVPKEPEG